MKKSLLALWITMLLASCGGESNKEPVQNYASSTTEVSSNCIQTMPISDVQYFANVSAALKLVESSHVVIERFEKVDACGKEVSAKTTFGEINLTKDASNNVMIVAVGYLIDADPAKNLNKSLAAMQSLLAVNGVVKVGESEFGKLLAKNLGEAMTELGNNGQIKKSFDYENFEVTVWVENEQVSLFVTRKRG